MVVGCGVNWVVWLVGDLDVVVLVGLEFVDDFVGCWLFECDVVCMVMGFFDDLMVVCV